MATRKKPDEEAGSVLDEPIVDGGITDQDAPAAPTGLPLFYRDPRPLSSERHGTRSIALKPDYSFSRHTNSVPVTAMECSRAMRDYPVVFTTGDPVVPVAILGLRGAANQFVNSEAGMSRSMLKS